MTTTATTAITTAVQNLVRNGSIVLRLTQSGEPTLVEIERLDRDSGPARSLYAEVVVDVPGVDHVLLDVEQPIDGGEASVWWKAFGPFDSYLPCPSPDCLCAGGGYPPLASGEFSAVPSRDIQALLDQAA